MIVKKFVDYDNHDNGCVSVHVLKEDDDVIFKIYDTGMGIPEESIALVFDRFYRVDKARSRQAGGSGLGLSIVKNLVKRNYGSIFLESEVGAGSCFTVVFPYFELEEMG